MVLDGACVGADAAVHIAEGLGRLGEGAGEEPLTCVCERVMIELAWANEKMSERG